jgi:hypothetical protein
MREMTRMEADRQRKQESNERVCGCARVRVSETESECDTGGRGWGKTIRVYRRRDFKRNNL